MSNSWHDFRQKAATAPKKIVLADGEDARVIKAAALAQSLGIAIPVLVGSASKISPIWQQFAPAGQEPNCIDASIMSTVAKAEYSDALKTIRKFKELTSEEIQENLKDSLVLGCLTLKMGRVEGFIGGASRTTADTLRAVFSIIGLAPRGQTLFGFFLVETQGTAASRPLVILADCAVIPEPSPKQLAQIALGSAAAYEMFFEEKARVAFLSFSTEGSAEHTSVLKIRDAIALARAKAPQIEISGEWQADAALDMTAAKLKGVGMNPMAGQANVLIMPDLNCGNISYKLVQRLGGCRAVGPVLWGTAQPANDLSRGCSTEDIIEMISLTALQAQHMPTLTASAGKGDH